MNKQGLLHWAEVIDSWRVFPRLFLAASFAWTVWVSSYLLHWYTLLPKEDRSLEASGFASVVVLAIFGFMKLVFDSYVQHGRDWDAQPSTTQTTVASTTTTVS
jgi:hypothetical protein